MSHIPIGASSAFREERRRARIVALRVMSSMPNIQLVKHGAVSLDHAAMPEAWLPVMALVTDVEAVQCGRDRSPAT